MHATSHFYQFKIISRTPMRDSARQFRAHPDIPMETADTEIQILHLEEGQSLQTRFL